MHKEENVTGWVCQSLSSLALEVMLIHLFEKNKHIQSIALLLYDHQVLVVSNHSENFLCWTMNWIHNLLVFVLEKYFLKKNLIFFQFKFLKFLYCFNGLIILKNILKIISITIIPMQNKLLLLTLRGGGAPNQSLIICCNCHVQCTHCNELDICIITWKWP